MNINRMIEIAKECGVEIRNREHSDIGHTICINGKIEKLIVREHLNFLECSISDKIYNITCDKMKKLGNSMNGE